MGRDQNRTTKVKLVCQPVIFRPMSFSDDLLADMASALIGGAKHVGILGLTTTTAELVAKASSSGLVQQIGGIFAEGVKESFPLMSVPVSPFEELAQYQFDVLVVAADAEKEEILLTALPHIIGSPRVLLAGYEHYRFRNNTLQREMDRLLVPSLANGYANCIVHIYQCLLNAARLGLDGVVAEFGAFRGGTTMLLSRLIDSLGVDWKVFAFDSFSGFPPRRSPLDMYDHPDCADVDYDAVARYLAGRRVELVAGDIVQTCHRLDKESLVLSFLDTDNYTPSKAALEICCERTVVGGAIVLDHFTGEKRFRYTLGERLAALPLLDDARYFHLHGTGVFYRQR